jgi:hypothetical protein
MNRKSLAIALAITAAAGSSFAESYTEHNTPFASSASRAEVAAQLAQPQQGVSPWSNRYNPLAQFRSTRTRAEVVGEYVAGRDVVNALNGEDSGSAYLAGGSTVEGRARFAGQPAAAI